MMKISKELLHHYYKLECCPDKFFSIGSDEKGYSPQPYYCPFCGKQLFSHQCDTFAIYSSRRIKKCVDCGKESELYDLEIKHQR